MNHLQEPTSKKAKLKLEKFNECPGADGFTKTLKKYGFTALSFVDSLNRQYWQNDYATAVFTVPQNGELLKFASIIHELAPDEFDYHFDNHLQEFIVRLWWD